ncbi:MAG: hypothetical protein QOE01_2341 [Actinomycetota bacterium]|jgi:hypothetical protein|nr:hypothetical protein [Actinomycetota bacterium]
MYKAHTRHLLTIAFVIYVVAAIIQAVFSLLGPFGQFLAFIVGIIAAFLLQATLIKAAEDVRDGRVDFSIRQTVEAARPFVGTVAIASILAGIAIGIGFVLIIVPGLFLLTIWCLIVPVIVLEGAGIGGAFERSRALVKGHGWQVFGTIILVFLLLLVVSILIALVLAVLPQAARSFIGGIVSGTLISPYVALVLTLSYFRLRDVHGAGPQAAGPPAPGGYGPA